MRFFALVSLLALSACSPFGRALVGTPPGGIDAGLMDARPDHPRPDAPTTCTPVSVWDTGIQEKIIDDEAGTPVPCMQTTDCPGGATLTGTVFAPNGIDPIAGALVYVPIGDDDLPGDLECITCDSMVASCAHTTAGPDGTFMLTGVPSGHQRIAVRKGLFHRIVEIDVTCGTNAMPADMTRLPHDALEGDVPRIAVANGDYDELECELQRIGLDPGAIDVFNNSRSPQQGGPSLDDLLHAYDILSGYHALLINSSDTSIDFTDQTVIDNLIAFVEGGGRLIVTDRSYDFIEQVPGWSPLVCWEGFTCCGQETEPQGAADVGREVNAVAIVGDTGLSAWLNAVHALRDDGATVSIDDLQSGWAEAKEFVDPVKQYLSARVDSATRPLALSFDVNGCGRVVYTSFHAAPRTIPCGPGTDAGGCVYPLYCDMHTPSPQERVFEYLLFDAFTCVPPPATQ